VSEGGARRWRRGRPSILIGRLLATGFTLFFLILALGDAATEGPALSTEGIAVALVLGLAMLAVILAWWDAALGALALAVVGLAMAILVAVTANRNQVPVAIVLGGPYVLSAALLWFGNARLRRA
jgi:hypothetical protein